MQGSSCMKKCLFEVGSVGWMGFHGCRGRAAWVCLYLPTYECRKRAGETHPSWLQVFRPFLPNSQVAFLCSGFQHAGRIVHESMRRCSPVDSSSTGVPAFIITHRPGGAVLASPNTSHRCHRTTPYAKQALSAGAPQHPSEAKPVLASFEPEVVYFQLLHLIYIFCSSVRLWISKVNTHLQAWL